MGLTPHNTVVLRLLARRLA